MDAIKKKQKYCSSARITSTVIVIISNFHMHISSTNDKKTQIRHTRINMRETEKPKEGYIIE
jgi:hypothetical protein